MEVLALIIIVVVLIIIYGIFATIRIIPYGSMCIVERLGKFSRECGPGLHILTPFIENFKYMRWTWRQEEDSGIKRVSFTGSLISVENCNFDVVPVTAQSKDHIDVEVNGTLLYKVTNLRDAVYNIWNLMGYLEDCVNQAVKIVINKYQVDELYGKDSALAAEIISEINTRTADVGVECTSFMIQSVNVDDKIMKVNEQMFATARVQKMAIEKQRKQHECRMEHVKQKHEWEMTKLIQEEEQTKKQLTLDHEKAEAQAARESVHWKMLTDLGFTTEEITSMEIAKTFKDAIVGSGDRSVVYAPPNLYSRMFLMQSEK